MSSINNPTFPIHDGKTLNKRQTKYLGKEERRRGCQKKTPIKEINIQN